MSRIDQLREMSATDTDECIAWPFCRDHGGYGLVTERRRTVGAHVLKGEPRRAIARRFADKVTRAAVCQILRGNSWSWLDAS